ncbi:MAG: O-antigen ligase family protein [Nodosilinea sp.]
MTTYPTTTEPPVQSRGGLEQTLAQGEFLFALLALAFFSGAHQPIATYLLGESTEGIFSSLLRYSIFAGALALLALRWRRSLAIARQGVLIWLLISLNIASYLWSELPEWSYLSIRGELLPVTLFGLYFASRYSLREQLRIVAIFLLFSAVGCILTVFLLPEVGKHPLTEFDGAWRGLYRHKNSLSAYMSLSALSFLAILFGKDHPKLLGPGLTWTGLGVTVALILLSTSATGLLLLIFLTAILLIYSRYRWRGKRSVLALNLGIGLGIAALIFVTLNWATILAGLGKDPTLTGRVLLWQGSLDFWQDKFWLGYGRDAFWHPDLPYAATVGSKIAWQYIPPHGHNGFIDTGLEVGVIGLGIFLLGLGLTLTRAFRMAYLRPAAHLLWAAGFLCLFVVFNFIESAILNGANLYFVLYLSVYLSLRLPKRELFYDDP